MYRAPSPSGYGGADQQRMQQAYAGTVAPNQVTYTTSTDADGRVIYHPFRAVAASYQTPTGVVNGIQWIPAEATKVLPPGAQPANAEFAASWSRTPITKEEQKALKEWQRDEEKRRKKEEKEARRQREKEQRQDSDNELRKARERDAHVLGSIERRRSSNQLNQGAVPQNSLAFPGAAATGSGYPAFAGGASGYQPTNPGYPSTPYTAAYNGASGASPYDQRERKYSTGVSDLDRQFGDMGLDRGAEYSGERERKTSGLARPRTYQTDAERARKTSNNFGERPGYQPAGYPAASGYPTAGYSAQGASNPYPSAYSNPSPSMRPGEAPQAPYASSAYANANYAGVPGVSPMARPTTPYAGPQPQQGVYPPGHVMEGKPFPGATPTIPNAIPAGYQPFPQQAGMPDPNTVDQGQLAAPDGFSRPINAAQAFTPFDKMKVQDMDSIVDNAPRMPAVLQPHDVYMSDWNRLMSDLCLAWTGRLPAPGRPQKKASLAAELIDMWNISFFFPRGVEVVLYKGRERRTGPSAGVVDLHLYEEDDSSSSSSSSSEDSDSDPGKYPQTTYMYGQQPYAPGQNPMTQVMEQRQRRREMRAEKKRRRKEKKLRRKERAQAKRYALYLTCVPTGGPPQAGAVSAGMPPPVGGGMGLGAGAMPPTAAMGYTQMNSMGMPGMQAMGGMGAPGYGAVTGGMPMTNHSGGY